MDFASLMQLRLKLAFVTRIFSGDLTPEGSVYPKVWHLGPALDVRSHLSVRSGTPDGYRVTEKFEAIFMHDFAAQHESNCRLFTLPVH
jgi:hypothetical protein